VNTNSLIKKILLLLIVVIYFFIIIEVIFILFNNSENADTINLELPKYGPESAWEESPYFSLKDVGDLNNKKVFRILNVGDSVVEGNCPDSSYLEELLDENSDLIRLMNKKIKKFDVINAGLGGTSIYTQISIFNISKDVIKPDLVILNTGWNAHWYKSPTPCQVHNCYEPDETEFSNFLKNFTLQSCRVCNYFSNIAADKIRMAQLEKCTQEILNSPDKFLEGIDHYDTNIYRVEINDFKKRLVEFITIARENDIQIILTTPPTGLIQGEAPFMSILDCVFIDAESYYTVHQMYMDIIREVAIEQDIYLIDLDKTFTSMDRDEYFDDPDFDPIHVNINGQRFCTEEFNKYLNDEYKDVIINN